MATEKVEQDGRQKPPGGKASRAHPLDVRKSTCPYRWDGGIEASK